MSLEKLIGPNLAAMEEQANEISSNYDVAQELGFDSDKEELYNTQLHRHLGEIFTKKRFTDRRYKKALKDFNEQFEKDWKSSEQTRRNEYMAKQKEPLLVQKIEQNDARIRELEKTHDYDAETNSWKKKLSPKLVPTLKTAGLNFGSVRDVQTWLTNNGFDTKGIDNMYGANTKAAIDKLLNDTTFGLTDEEKQKFRDFQNSATFYRAKKVKTPDPQGSPFKTLNNAPQAPISNLGLSVTPVTLGLTGSYKDYNKFIAPGFGPKVERKEGDLYVDESGELVSSILYDPKNNNNQSQPKKEGTIYTADYLKESKNFRGRHGLDQLVLINGKQYPVLVTRDILPKEQDPYEDINDWSYAYDEEAGKILRLNETPVLSYGTTSGMDTLKWVDVDEFVQDPLKFYGRKKNGGTINKYKQGNKMNNEQELQRAFMAYLIEDAAAQGVQIQSEQDLQAYAQQLGEEGLKAKYQEFMQKMQGGQGVKAALGAKLNYIRKIKGMCPDGQETYFFKEGGSVKSGCKPCMAKAQKGQELKKKGNAVDQFKNRHINSNDTVWADGDKNKARTLTDDRDRPIVKGMKPYSAAEYQRDMAKGKKGDKAAARRVEKQNEKTMYACGGKSKKKKN